MSSNVMYTVVGIIGAALLLFGFYRLSIGRWTNKSFIYELDNLVGALLLLIYQLHMKAYIGVVINAVWAIVAFKGITPFAERYATQQRGKTRKYQKSKR